MVPRESARLRTIISAGHTKEDLDQALTVIEACARELGLIK
jgi:glycine C-acetyltransferase